MGGDWFHIPVLIERSASCDVALALQLVAKLKAGEQVDLDYGEARSDDEVPSVRDCTGASLGRITASAWQRFGLLHDGEHPKVGEFARALEFGWLMRVQVQRLSQSPNLSSVL